MNGSLGSTDSTDKIETGSSGSCSCKAKNTCRITVKGFQFQATRVLN